jgi:hypothetical protein
LVLFAALYWVMGSVEPSISVADLSLMSILCRFGRSRPAAVAAADCANLFFSRCWRGMIFPPDCSCFFFSGRITEVAEILRGNASMNGQSISL